jgi:hypothetical protein
MNWIVAGSSEQIDAVRVIHADTAFSSRPEACASAVQTDSPHSGFIKWIAIRPNLSNRPEIRAETDTAGRAYGRLYRIKACRCWAVATDYVRIARRIDCKVPGAVRRSRTVVPPDGKRARTTNAREEGLC